MPYRSMVTAAAFPLDPASLARINKAGRSLAALRTAAIDGEVDLDAMTREEKEPINREVELLEGWRERHAGRCATRTRTSATTAKATVTEFDDYDAALSAYESIEMRNLSRNDLDIVLLGADSLETIEKTHASYFATTEGGFEQFLGDLLTNV